ncbi:protein kinase [Gordonia sp. VNQ95]|uniref:protein kinase domain-containing protein n=1 Tax=Gordonia sp. VNQ95 TaxID=3156619 RepID=UPI0032B3BF35
MPWCATEFVDGPDLAHAGGLSPTDLSRVVGDVAAALDAAHAQGVLHRAVTPANVIVTRGDDGAIARVVVTDFGVAGADSGPESLSFAAPELLQGGMPSPASDQYALAVLVFACLTGRLPFEAPTPAGLMMAQLSAPVPSVGDPAVDAVLARALAKDPRARFVSCGEFAGALKAAVGVAGSVGQRSVSLTKEAGAPAAPVAPGGPVVPPARPSSRRKWLWAIPVGVVALLAVIAIVAVVVVRGGGGDPDPRQIANPAAGSNWTAVDGFMGTACGVDGGELYCWADEEWSHTYIDFFPDANPAPFGSLQDVTDVSFDGKAGCAVAGGEVYCWGSYGSADYSPPVTTPTRLAGIDKVTKIVGASTGCALSEGDVYCWGHNKGYRVADSLEYPDDTDYVAVPTKVPGLGHVTDVAISGSAYCALSDGTPYCWGNNAYGLLGNGRVDENAVESTPRPVVDMTGIAGITKISGGGGAFCVLQNGTPECWGHLLGDDGQYADVPKPTPVPGVHGYLDIAVGSGPLICGISSAHEVYCWGSNYDYIPNPNGTLGDNVPTPVKIDGLDGASKVVVPFRGMCAIRSGDLFCMGLLKPPGH